jgi:amino acid adenylation domain-containing protein
MAIAITTQLSVPDDLSVAQTAIWLDQQLFGDRPIYNTGQALTLRGSLRFDLLEKAMREAIDESPGLQLPPRAVPLNFELHQHDFRLTSAPLAAAERWMRAEMDVPIAINQPPLFRFALVRVADDQTIWFQKYHHLVIDATGRQLLSARVATRYRALCRCSAIPALEAATPADVLKEERHYAQSAQHAVDRDYWLQRFADLPEPLVGTDRQGSERGRSGRHARVGFTLPRSAFARLQRAAQTLNSTASRAVIALTYAAFARFYDRTEIVLGIELANRSNVADKQMIGILARPLPLKLGAEAGASIADVLCQVDEARAADYAHRRFPIQELVTDLGIVRRGRHALFDVVVNYVPLAYDFAFENEPVEVTNLSYGFAAPWMVTIADTGAGRDLDVAIDTDPGLVGADSAAQMAACLETLLLWGLEQPDRPVRLLPIMPASARGELRALQAAMTAPLPENETLTSLFLTQAEKQPDRVALVCGAEELTFGALDTRAACLARRLAGLGVVPGSIVGIALPRTPALLAAVLAVHKAGAAYLPLDPSYPAERIRYIVADSAVPVIVTSAALAAFFADSGAQVLLDQEPADLELEIGEPCPPQPGDLAYVLYTSGSTGRPKAVGVEHRSLVNLVFWGRSVISDAELAGMLFSTSLNFDISAFEMFLPLVFGGCMVMVENLLALPTTPCRERVRFINTGPSLIQALLRTGALPREVTTVLLAGEKLSRHIVAELSAAAPGIRILNCYGPTETTVYSSCAQIDPAAHSDPSIGRPIWNTTLQVLSSSGGLLPIGQEGELYIGGVGVARGYLGQPELTAERFIADEHGPGRLYRTGDRVRWRSDGELEFLGRADDQIKINGVRIEPGEIEAALLTVPSVSMAALMLREDDDGQRRLTAYLVPKDGATQATDRVRASLTHQLPHYMVPTSFVWLKAMPMTPNGKLNRKALPAPPREQSRSSPDRRPASALERELAQVWGNVLGTSPLDVSLDFFDLGGDSLALLNLFAAVEARFRRRLSVDVLAGGLTIAKLAQLLTNDRDPQMQSSQIVPLQSHGHLPPFFIVPGIGGDVLQLHRLGLHMRKERPVYAFRWLSDHAESATVRDIASAHVASMLALQPAGPYFFGGYCLGAMVAFEMAHRLKELGHEIGMLGIIDQRRSKWRFTLRDLLPAFFRTSVNISLLFRDQLTPLSALRRIVGASGRRLQNWTRTAIGLPTAQVDGVFELNRSLQGRIPGEQYFPALRGYRPVPLNVPATLFRATDAALLSLPLDWTLGWSSVIEGGIEVHKVPGDHLSITAEPLVRHLARTLSDAIDRAQGVLPYAPAS